MAEEKEQLRISAELDTSKLKRDAQQGMQTVVNEEKKVENQSKQTSKAIDEIGQKGKSAGSALQQAGTAGTQALKQVGQEADKTAKKVEEIAKATKSINIKQGIGIATQIAGQLAPLGKAAGSAMGMSDTDMDVLGAGLSGAASGAAIGTMINPGVGTAIGAAAGALVGAGTVLLTAGQELQKAARTEEERWNLTKEQSYKRQDNEQFQSMIKSGTMDELRQALKEEEGKIRDANANIADLRGQNAEVTRRVVQTVIDPVSGGQWEKETIVRDEAKTKENAIKLTEQLTEEENKRTEAVARRLALITAIEQKEKAAKAKADADAKAKNDTFVGPQMPPEIAAQREAERQYQQMLADEAAKKQRAFDSYTIEQKRENISNLQDTQLKPLESMMNGMASFKLTDSLTRIGGGAGYGVQMQGINRYVTNISNNIQSIKGIIQQELDAIKELNNKYKPYYGEFMAQTDN